MGRNILYVVQHKEKVGRMDYATLKRQLQEAGRVAVQCPVCGRYDNDWPERDGLCCSCWCAAWCAIVDAARAAGRATPDVEKVRKVISWMMEDSERADGLKRMILARRTRTGTFIRRKEDGGSGT